MLSNFALLRSVKYLVSIGIDWVCISIVHDVINLLYYEHFKMAWPAILFYSNKYKNIKTTVTKESQ